MSDVLITDFEITPGEHCGSTAMRNLLRHYAELELSEAMVFGLGSGLDLLFAAGDMLSPSVLAFGRSPTLEADAALALGLDYREEIELDDERAWELVRDEVAQGRPVMLTGDYYHLDHAVERVHFPAHRFVLVGYDDERDRALIADRVRPVPEEVAYASLARSRNPTDYPLSTFNLWGRFVDASPTRSLAEALAVALPRNAARMLGRDDTHLALLRANPATSDLHFEGGLAGLRALRSSLRTWPERADGAALAGFLAHNIEDYGTGGGNFRRLYTRFLDEARALVGGLVPADAVRAMRESDEAWTELADILDMVADGMPWGRWPEVADALLTRIVALETEVFEMLAA